MIKQQIYPSGTVANDKFFLPSYKRKTGAEFKQEAGNILFQSRLKLFFPVIDRNGYKSEVIIIFRYFLSHAALSLRQIFREIAYCLSMRFI